MTALIILGTYLVAAIASVRFVGAWWLGRHDLPMRSVEAFCHGEHEERIYQYRKGVQQHRADCVDYHFADCWRVGPIDPILRDRTLRQGFVIIGLALIWPLLALPFLALWATPETAAETKRRNAELRAENDRLERELRLATEAGDPR